MARKARVEFEGAAYHVLDRGEPGERLRANRPAGTAAKTGEIR